MKAPVCRVCGKAEWNHVCYRVEEVIRRAEAAMAPRPEVVTKPAITKPDVTEPPAVTRNKGGRPRLGAEPMTPAERQRRARSKRAAKGALDEASRIAAADKAVDPAMAERMAKLRARKAEKAAEGKP